MLIHEYRGDMFEHIKPGKAYAHGVNCRGVMGAGVAKEVRKRFPKNYLIYRSLCEQEGLTLGDFTFTIEHGVMIYNLATQYNPGPHADPAAIHESVESMMYHASTVGVKAINTVRLGCGIGGLDWTDVRPVLESIDSTVKLNVYHLA